MKQFKLPKEFAEKWLIALRSGEYKQGTSYLQQYLTPELAEEEVEYSSKNCAYCCLGVAGMVAGVNPKNLNTEYFYPERVEFETKIPSELIGMSDDSLLVKILSNLNDSINYTEYKEFIKDQGYIFREDLEQFFSDEESTPDKFRLNFNQIADFIEDNVEFY